MVKINDTEITVDTRTRTYEDFRQTMVDAIPLLSPEWTDLYPHDPGVVILELLASQLDTLQYYIDRGVGESHLITAQRLKSVKDIASLVGYSPRLNAAASVDVQVNFSTTGQTLYGIDSISQVPFQVSTQTTNGQELFTFELEQETVVSSSSMTLSFIEGKTTLNESAGVSNGRPGQRFRLLKPNVTFGSSGSAHIKVNITDGITSDYWTYTSDSSFINFDSTDKVFRIEVSSDGYCVLIFGDGTNGRIPPVDNAVVVTYRTGGGTSANNVGAGRISKVITSTVNATSCTNAAKPSGGLDRDNALQIKLNAPRVWATQNRIITNEDYEAIAGNVSGVYKVRSCPYMNRPTEQAVYIAVDGDDISAPGLWNVEKQHGTGLKGEVGRTLLQRSPSGIRLRILDFNPVFIEVSADINLLRNYVQSDVRNKAINAIRNHVRSSSFNGILPLSNAYNLIRDIVGIDYVTISKHKRLAYIEPVSIGLADTLLGDVVTGDSTQTETITLRFVSDSEFEVEGSISGQHPNGSVGLEYTSTNGEVRFTLTAGSYPNKTLDEYRIITSKNIDNITLQDFELPVYLLDNVSINLTGGIPG